MYYLSSSYLLHRSKIPSSLSLSPCISVLSTCSYQPSTSTTSTTIYPKIHAIWFYLLQNSSNSEENPSLTPINLHILHSLWLPDVEILDLKAFETHSVLSKLEGRCIVNPSLRPGCSEKIVFIQKRIYPTSIIGCYYN